jgi:hypothetical protein
MYITNMQMSWGSGPGGFASSVRTPPPILQGKPLFQEFSTTGQFWLPSNPDRVLWGSLTFKPGDGVNLALDGDLLGENTSHGGVFLETVHGRTFNGNLCTLFRCTSYADTYFGGVTRLFRSNVSADYLVGGELFSSLDQCVLSSVYVQFSHLDDWFEAPYRVRHKRGGFKKGLVTFIPNDFEIRLHLEEQAFTVKLFCGRTIPSHATRDGVCWTYFYKLYLEPTHPQPLLWYLKVISHLRGCFIFLIGAGVYTLDLDAALPERQTENGREGYPEQRVKIYLVVDVPSVVQVDPAHFSTRYQRLKDQFPSLVMQWFEQRDELLAVTRAYSETLINDGSYEETIFLRVVQTLEHFHGLLFASETYFTKAGWVNFLDWLRDKFPDSIREDTAMPEGFASIRDLVIQRISALNKLSFRSKLNQLFRQAPGHALMPVMGNPADLDAAISGFLRSVEVTRNYLTHYDPTQEKHALTGEKLQEAISFCWAVLTLWLANKLGLDDATSRSMAINSKRAMFLVSLRTGL